MRTKFFIYYSKYAFLISGEFESAANLIHIKHTHSEAEKKRFKQIFLFFASFFLKKKGKIFRVFFVSFLDDAI